MFQWDSPKSTGIFFRVDPLGKLDVLAVFPEDVPPNIRLKGAGNGKYIEEKPKNLMNAMDFLRIFFSNWEPFGGSKFVQLFAGIILIGPERGVVIGALRGAGSRPRS